MSIAGPLSAVIKGRTVRQCFTPLSLQSLYHHMTANNKKDDIPPLLPCEATHTIMGKMCAVLTGQCFDACLDWQTGHEKDFKAKLTFSSCTV